MPGDVDERGEARGSDAPEWRAVFENSAIGVALTDLNGRFSAVNRAYERMLGYSEAELRTLTFQATTNHWTCAVASQTANDAS